MQFTASFITGLALGLLNWLFWTLWGKKLARQKDSKPGGLVLAGLLKLAVLGGVIWFLLNSRYVTPGGFLTGFGVAVFFIIIKGFGWK